jgi:hypothetical protein
MSYSCYRHGISRSRFNRAPQGQFNPTVLSNQGRHKTFFARTAQLVGESVNHLLPMKQWRRLGRVRMITIPSCTYPSMTPLKIAILASLVAIREGLVCCLWRPYTKDKTMPRLVAAGHFPSNICSCNIENAIHTRLTARDLMP